MHETKSNLEKYFILGCLIVACFAVYYGGTEKISQEWSSLLQTGVQLSWGNKETQSWKQEANSWYTIWTKYQKLSGYHGQQYPARNLQITSNKKIQPTTKQSKVKSYELAFTKINNVVNNTGITKHIIYACETARNQPHCINMILWVSKAESSIFRNCSQGNCLGLKPGGNLKEFPNVKYCIDYRVEKYNKFRYTNKNGSDMINRSHYCDGACANTWSNWILAVDSFINYIN